MPILDEKAMNDLKWNYNHNLKRYWDGCEYLKKHKKDIDKWLPELLEILNDINLFLEEIMKYESVTDKQILEGFEI